MADDEEAQTEPAAESAAPPAEADQGGALTEAPPMAEAPQPGTPSTAEGEPLDAIYDISIDVTAVLGTATMPVSQLLKMGRGAVVQLDRMVDEEIELRCKGMLIARGEVIVIDDHLGVNLTTIIKRHISNM